MALHEFTFGEVIAVHYVFSFDDMSQVQIVSKMTQNLSIALVIETR